MSELRLSALRIAAGEATFDSVTAVAQGRRLALVGDWRPLFALLSGRAESFSGSVSIDGQDARSLVIRGRVGIGDPALDPSPDQTVSEWLTASLLLRGWPVAGAENAARATLDGLGVGYLGRYRGGDLPAPARYAARAALAASTTPEVVVLGAPSWTAETQPFERLLLERLAERAALFVCVEPTTHPEWFSACDAAILLAPEGATSVVPRELWRDGARHYSLIPIENRETLLAALRARDVTIVAAPERGEVWVTLPERSGPELLASAALEAGSGLFRLTPLFAPPAHG